MVLAVQGNRSFITDQSAAACERLRLLPTVPPCSGPLNRSRNSGGQTRLIDLFFYFKNINFCIQTAIFTATVLQRFQFVTHFSSGRHLSRSF